MQNNITCVFEDMHQHSAATRQCKVLQCTHKAIVFFMSVVLATVTTLVKLICPDTRGLKQRKALIVV